MLNENKNELSCEGGLMKYEKKTGNQPTILF